MIVHLKAIAIMNVSLFLFSCAPQDKNKDHGNIIAVQQPGDTMRIEIEKREDRIIRHFIDLKKDDGFDNSYDITCIYESRAIDSNVFVNNKQVPIRAVLTENYSSPFSSGKHIYFISNKNDTIFYATVEKLLK